MPQLVQVHLRVLLGAAADATVRSHEAAVFVAHTFRHFVTCYDVLLVFESEKDLAAI